MRLNALATRCRQADRFGLFAVIGLLVLGGLLSFPLPVLASHHPLATDPAAPSTVGSLASTEQGGSDHDSFGARILLADIWSKLQGTSRARMLQVGIVGMALAIYIMLWRK